MAKVKSSVETLDRSRPFGEVYGEHEHNVKFEQGGWPYDAHGRLIEAALTPRHVEILEKRRAQAEARAAKLTEEQTKVDQELPPENDENEPEAADIDGDEESDGPNLIAWLKGDARYTPLELNEAMKKRYGANIRRPKDIAIYLVEEKALLPRDQVSLNILPKA